MPLGATTLAHRLLFTVATADPAGWVEVPGRTLSHRLPARTQDLAEVTVDGELVALRLLADRRDELAGARTVSRLHRLLLELIPAGAPRFLSAAQAKALLATVRPRDVAGRTRRQLAAELLADIVVLDRKLKDSDKRLSEAVGADGTGVLDLYGIGSVGAARILGDVGNVARFANRAHFASWTGTAPIDASSGQQVRHRLSRAGTGGSTGSCTSWPSSRSATTPTAAPTTGANSPPARPRWKRSAASSDDCPTWSSGSSSPTPPPRGKRAREDTRGRL